MRLTITKQAFAFSFERAFRLAFAALLVLSIFLFASDLAAQTTDGTVATPPAVETIAGWKWTYLHFNAPTDGNAANAVVRVSYMTSGGKELEATDIRIDNGDPGVTTDNELSSLLAAMATPASGEPATAALKVRFRVKKWLIDNGKLKYGAN